MPFNTTPVTLLASSQASTHWQQFRVNNITAIIVSILLLHYLLTLANFNLTKNPNGKNQRPPLIPHVVPIVGLFPLDFVRSPLRFALTSHIFWKRHPVRVRAFFQDIYIIQGDKSLISFMKEARLPAALVNRTFLVRVFKLPRAADETYSKDDSGEHAKPNPGSNVPHRNRIAFHTRSSHHRFLVGPGQPPLLRRLHYCITKRLSQLEIKNNWSHVGDFLGLFKHHLTAASVDSFVGPALMDRNPSFPSDIWAIKDNLFTLLLGLPKFLSPEGYLARDRAINAIVEWHAWASQNYSPDAVSEDGSDPYWGCAYFRERQKTFLDIDGYDTRALASEDLSLLWSAQANSVGTAFWVTLEAFRDPELLKAVRDEVGSCIESKLDEPLRFDVDKLLRQPLVQAMFAETLRLRVHGFLLRRPKLGDVRINTWRIPQNQLCVASCTPAGMDPEFWCAGENAGHPAPEFWPGRFLRKDPETGEVKFSLSGTEGYWIPFGGGRDACPGRAYAKHEIIITLATMVTTYDCDILAKEEAMMMDTWSIPVGTVDPSDRVPVRLRRRQPTLK